MGGEKVCERVIYTNTHTHTHVWIFMWLSNPFRHECPICRAPVQLEEIISDKHFDELIGYLINILFVILYNHLIC